VLTHRALALRDVEGGDRVLFLLRSALERRERFCPTLRANELGAGRELATRGEDDRIFRLRLALRPCAPPRRGAEYECGDDNGSTHGLLSKATSGSRRRASCSSRWRWVVPRRPSPWCSREAEEAAARRQWEAREPSPSRSRSRSRWSRSRSQSQSRARSLS